MKVDLTKYENPPAEDWAEDHEMTVREFVEALGITDDLIGTLRAIDKHNGYHVWLVLRDGTRLYYDTDGIDGFDSDLTPVTAIGLGGIAWDGADWEWSDEVDVKAGDDVSAVVDALGESFNDALADHEFHESFNDFLTFVQTGSDGPGRA